MAAFRFPDENVNLMVQAYFIVSDLVAEMLMISNFQNPQSRPS